MSKQEKIVCAAIAVYSVKDGYSGTKIIKGINYESIIEDGLISEISHPTHQNIFIRGFVTNKNNFVNPKDSLRMSGLKNQLRFKDRDYLLPEDLY